VYYLFLLMCDLAKKKGQQKIHSTRLQLKRFKLFLTAILNRVKTVFDVLQLTIVN
jgi:hypothetical protein